MIQVNYKKDRFRGRFAYFPYDPDENNDIELDWDLGTFSDFMYYMKVYIEKYYNKLTGDSESLKNIDLIGITFNAREDSESFSVDMFDAGERVTMVFDESKFEDINLSKLKRIKDIINE